MSFIPPASDIRSMMAKAPSDALNLAIGEPVFPTPAPVLTHLKQHIQQWQLGYTQNAGLPELREKIARSQTRFTTSAQVCVSSGAQEALYAACYTLLSPGDEALVPDPGFLAYPNLVRMVNATPVSYPMPCSPGQIFNIDALESRMTIKTKILLLNSPSNPTGFCFSSGELADIAKICERNGITIISDEVYRELFYGITHPPSMYDFSDNCILISSLSKTFSMTGWRLGWAIGPVQTIASLTRIHQYLVTCASALSQHVANYIFDGHLASAVETFRKTLRRRRDLLMKHLPTDAGWRIDPPDAGLFLFTRPPESLLKKGCPSEHLLRDYNIISVPGGAFGSNGKGFVRLSFAAKDETIKEVGKRLKTIT